MEAGLKTEALWLSARTERLPPEIVAELKERALGERVFAAAFSRMSPGGKFRGTWLLILESRVLLLKDAGEGWKCLFDTPLRELDSVKAVPLTGGVLLVAVRNGSQHEILRVDSGQAPLFAGLAHELDLHAKMARGFEPVDEDRLLQRYTRILDKHRSRFCSTCHRPLQRNSKVCSFCLKRSATLWRILSYALPYWKSLALMGGLMVAGTAFSLVPPQIARVLIDDVLLNPDRAGLLPWLVGVLAVVMAVTQGFVIWRSRLGVRIGSKVTTDIQLRAFQHLQALSLGFFNKQQTGALMSRINNDAKQMQSFLVEGLQYTVVNLFTIAGIAAILLWMNPLLGILVLAPLPFAVLLSTGLWRRVRRRFRLLWAAYSSVTSYLNDTLSGIRVIKSFGKEERECSRFEGKLSLVRRKTIEAEQTWQTWIPILQLIIQSSLLLVWYFGAFEVYGGRLSIGELVAYISYLAMIFGPLQLLTRLNDWLTRALTAAARVFEILDTEEYVSEKSDAQPVDRPVGEIELRNVTFGYERHQPVIKSLSLRIGAGEMVGFVGRSGAGKSTLINLIGRLFDPDEGTILLDGTDLRNLRLSDLRRHIGYVLQDNFLFSATIAQNIAYSRPDAPPSEILHAAMLANAHDFIMQLPDGYDTYVGERGARISGGERQRIAIARALLQDPKILILDEATSSVDTETEAKIQEALSRLIQGRTTIAIAHRLSTLRHASQLIVLDQGELVEQGTHAELMRGKGVYHRLVKVQTEWNRMIGVGG